MGCGLKAGGRRGRLVLVVLMVCSLYLGCQSFMVISKTSCFRKEGQADVF